jgi:hypothetical protein
MMKKINERYPALSSICFIIFLMLFAVHKLSATEKNTSFQAFVQQHAPHFSDPNYSWKLLHENKTAFSQHQTWGLFYFNWPVKQAFIQLHLNNQGKIISHKIVLPNSPISGQLSEQTLNSFVLNENLLHTIQAQLPENLTQKTEKIIHGLDTVQMAIQVEAYNASTDQTWIFDVNGQLLQQYDNRRFLKKDTLIQAKIFNPDPLTKLNQVYGLPYKDSSDLDLPWFQSAYDTVWVPVYYDDVAQIFIPENDYAVIEDFENPSIAPSTGNNPILFFGRNQGGFEEYNILWHIHQFHDHISSLGYDTLMDLQVRVDAHGLFGADNSVFNRNGGNPTLSFGIGGVDDAEDADVIIHEYCHGISWSANSNDNFSYERSALDEGLADYFATSYSRDISAFNWQKMFTWDGHNEFWGGRTATSSNVYPNGSGIYALGEIWNAAMSAIWTDLGRTVTDKLMLECLHFFNNSTTLPEAAYYMMQCDTLLFGGIHANTICTHFRNRNLLDLNCKPVGVADYETKKSEQIIFGNTLGFSQGEGDLFIEFPEVQNWEIILTNIQGQIIFTQKETGVQRWTLSPDHLQPGVYVITCTNETKKKYFSKLIKK